MPFDNLHSSTDIFEDHIILVFDTQVVLGDIKPRALKKGSGFFFLFDTNIVIFV